MMAEIDCTPPSAAPATLGELRVRIREDVTANRSDWSKPGSRALIVHRFGNWRMQIGNRVLRAPFTLLHRSLFRRCRNIYGVEIPWSAKVGRNVVVEHQGGIVIHGDATIGDGSTIRQGVTIGNRSLDAPFDAPVIGRDVNIGAGAVIVGAIRLGDGCAVGANSVVLHDVPAGATVAGAPARPVSAAATRSHRELPESSAA